MFILTGFGVMLIAAWGASRGNEKDREMYDRPSGKDSLPLHTRQDLKTICFLLAGLMIEIAIIAEIVVWRLMNKPVI
jgi:hypothetical protein